MMTIKQPRSLRGFWSKMQADMQMPVTDRPDLVAEYNRRIESDSERKQRESDCKQP